MDIIAIILIVFILTILLSSKKTEGYHHLSLNSKQCSGCGTRSRRNCSNCQNCGYCFPYRECLVYNLTPFFRPNNERLYAPSTNQIIMTCNRHVTI